MYLRVGADVEAVVEQDVFRDHVDVLYDGLAHRHVHGVARQLRDARRGGVVAGFAESLLRHSTSLAYPQQTLRRAKGGQGYLVDGGHSALWAEPWRAFY